MTAREAAGEEIKMRKRLTALRREIRFAMARSSEEPVRERLSLALYYDNKAIRRAGRAK